MLVEVDHRVMLVDFDERARPISGLDDAVALGPRFHSGLPARLAASAGAVAAEAAAAATTEAAYRFRPRPVHRQAPSAHLILIEFGGGLLRLLVGRHFDERESPGAA